MSTMSCTRPPWPAISVSSSADASPYFRVFNPVTQGEKFDPSGEYVRRWVPELRHLEGKQAHEPWDAEDGYAHRLVAYRFVTVH